jgi:hypothetical protein
MNFTPKGYHTEDDYMTPFSTWKSIAKYLPKDKVIWEAFHGDGTSGDHLRALGFEVVHKNIDFFDSDEGEIIVSNPPFSKAKAILKRLKSLNKPFVLILPISKLARKYFQTLFPDIQLIIPKSRIQFIRNNKHNCNFDTAFFCWKMSLERDIIFL